MLLSQRDDQIFVYSPENMKLENASRLLVGTAVVSL